MARKAQKKTAAPFDIFGDDRLGAAITAATASLPPEERDEGDPQESAEAQAVGAAETPQPEENGPDEVQGL